MTDWVGVAPSEPGPAAEPEVESPELYPEKKSVIVLSPQCMGVWTQTSRHSEICWFNVVWV